MNTNKRHNPDDLDLEAVGHPTGDTGPNRKSVDPVTGVEADLERLEAELHETREKYQRVLADSRNAQQRAAASEREARSQGAMGVLHSVLRVLDHFDLALGQDPKKATAEQIQGGVRMIRDELLRALGAHGVASIEPRVNEPFDPMRHEAVQELPAEGVAPGNVARPLQSGYSLGDRVLRPARVAVAPKKGPSPNPGGCGSGSCGCHGDETEGD